MSRSYSPKMFSITSEERRILENNIRIVESRNTYKVPYMSHLPSITPSYSQSSSLSSNYASHSQSSSLSSSYARDLPEYPAYSWYQYSQQYYGSEWNTSEVSPIIPRQYQDNRIWQPVVELEEHVVMTPTQTSFDQACMDEKRDLDHTTGRYISVQGSPSIKNPDVTQEQVDLLCATCKLLPNNMDDIFNGPMPILKDSPQSNTIVGYDCKDTDTCLKVHARPDKVLPVAESAKAELKVTKEDAAILKTKQALNVDKDCTGTKCIQNGINLRLVQSTLAKQTAMKDAEIQKLKEELAKISNENLELKNQLHKQDQERQSEFEKLKQEAPVNKLAAYETVRGQLKTNAPEIIGLYQPRISKKALHRVPFTTPFTDISAAFDDLMAQTKKFVKAWLAMPFDAVITPQLLEYLQGYHSNPQYPEIAMMDPKKRQSIMQSILNQALVHLVFKGPIVYDASLEIAQCFQLEERISYEKCYRARKEEIVHERSKLFYALASQPNHEEIREHGIKMIADIIFELLQPYHIRFSAIGSEYDPKLFYVQILWIVDAAFALAMTMWKEPCLWHYEFPCHQERFVGTSMKFQNQEENPTLNRPDSTVLMAYEPSVTVTTIAGNQPILQVLRKAEVLLETKNMSKKFRSF